MSSPVRIRYQTIEFEDVDIHVRTLRDNQQFSDDEGIASRLGICSASWPLFGILWPASEVLARLMTDFEIAHKRILEVGCGIALSSLVLNHRLADITATDHHPEAEKFLLSNSQLNQDQDIPFVRTGWQDAISELGEFDVIIGSDLLYEPNHARLLSEFINQHARQQCEVIIVDPGRSQHNRFTRYMIQLGFSHTQTQASLPENHSQTFNGLVLRYSRLAS